MTAQRDPAQVLEDLARERLTPHPNQLPGIRARIEAHRARTRRAAYSMRLAALLAFVVLLVLLSLPDTAAALKRLMGYLPGVGPVDTTAPLRVLAEPVSGRHTGFTLTMDNALLDSTQTILQFHIAGPFPTQDKLSPGSNLCQTTPRLRLADGTEWAATAGETHGGDGQMSYQITFPALAESQNQAWLRLPCVQGQTLGEPPFDWEIPLHFAPAPADLSVSPLLDLPPGESMETATGLRLRLEQAAETPTGYYLKARLDWSADAGPVQLFPDSIRITDSAGENVPLADWSPGDSTGTSLTFALNLAPPAHPGPVHISVVYVAQELAPEPGSRLSLDVGDNPQPGQTWPVNQEFSVHGYTVRVLSAEYVQEAPQAPSILMLHLQAEPDVLLARFVDSQPPLAGGGGSPNSPNTSFRAALYYTEFPRGTITLSEPTLSVRREGPWSTTWDPPVIDPGTAPRRLAHPVTAMRDGYSLTVNEFVLTAQGSILTYTVALPQSGTRPSGLQPDTCQQQTRLRLADGGEKISLEREGAGTDSVMQYTENFPAFRADETPTRLVISCLSGLPTGSGPQNWEVALQFVPGAPATPASAPTLPPVPNPACLTPTRLQAALADPAPPLPAGLSGRLAYWEGDGQAGTMLVSRLDGSQRQALGAGLFPALAPDQQRIVYRHADGGLHLLTLADGVDVRIPGSSAPNAYNNSPAWSPDGQFIAFTRFANGNSDLYVVDADGSNLHPLLATPQEEVLVSWAPDSRAVVYSQYEGQVYHLMTLDLPSGDTHELGTLPFGTILFALSPDGQHLVYTNAHGVFTANTTDWVPTFLFDPGLQLGWPLVWSPDSQWLALSYWGVEGQGPVQLAFFEPATCQLILSGESGNRVSSWAP